MDELINILIDKKRNVLLEKYNLDLEAFEKIVDSMKKGKWDFIG
jgi:hypothetical protein